MTETAPETSRDSSGFSLQDFPLDEQQIAASVLNIEDKERSNLLPWNGQFSPQFVDAMLSHYARPDELIYDPFCGSGTVLCESGRLNLHALGSEVNPAAFHLARVYTLMQKSPGERSGLLHLLEDAISDFAGPDCDAPDDDVREPLLNLAYTARDDAQIIMEALVILSNFNNSAAPENVWRAWTRLHRTIEQLPFTTAPIAAELRDCRCPFDLDRPIDLVLTSPPYINVYNYHQQYRNSAEALGWDLLSIAKSEIGSNRKHRGNRFLTVIQYCLDMAANLLSMTSRLADTGRIIMVLGRESRVRGIPFFNGEIVARLGLECANVRLVQRQQRAFVNRFGQRIVEDILHFTKGQRASTATAAEQAARAIASEILIAALDSTAARDVRADLEAAISGVANVCPSPTLGHSRNYRRHVA